MEVLNNIYRYFRRIWLGIKSTAIGMSITLRRLFAPSVTLQYPDQKWKVPKGYRGMLYNDTDDCIVCDQCADICPADCIMIEGVKAEKEEDLGKTTTGVNKKIKLLRFDIELNHCLYCGLCTEVCPTECLVMTEETDYATYNREGLYMRYLPDGDRKKTEESLTEEQKQAWKERIEQNAAQ